MKRCIKDITLCIGSNNNEEEEFGFTLSATYKKKLDLLARAMNKESISIEIDLAINNENNDLLYDIGYMFYVENEYVDRDIELSVKALTHAEKFGSKYASYILADIYVEGLIDVKDDLIIETLKKAAKEGYSEAMYFLGYRYGNGYGVEQSETTSLYWYGKALLNNSSNMLDFLKSRNYNNDDIDELKLNAKKYAA